MQDYFSGVQRRKAGRRRRIRLYLACSLIFSLFIGGTVFLKTSPFFFVQHIEVKGVEGDTAARLLSSLQSSITATRTAHLLGKQNFLAWIAAGNLALPEFITLRISKNWLARTVSIEAEPRKRLAVWCGTNPTAGEKCFWYDEKEGVLFEETVPSRGQLIKTIEEENGTTLRLGDHILSEAQFSNMRRIIAGLDDFNFTRDRLLLDRTHQEIMALTSDGATLKFSLRFSPEESLAGLAELVRKGTLKKAKSVDFTVEHKIYLTDR